MSRTKGDLFKVNVKRIENDLSTYLQDLAGSAKGSCVLKNPLDVPSVASLGSELGGGKLMIQRAKRLAHHGLEKKGS